MENTIPVGISNRHAHVSQADLEVLFGAGHALKEMRPLRQPGQYAAEEVISIVGPKGRIDNVRILGPVRKATQIEIAQTDSFKLGVKPPVRDSGDIDASSAITLVGPQGEVKLEQGCILACRHVHMSPEDAARFGVADKDKIRVRTEGERSMVLENVLVRVNPAFLLEFHVDTDEGNAALLKNGDLVKVAER